MLLDSNGKTIEDEVLACACEENGKYFVKVRALSNTSRSINYGQMNRDNIYNPHSNVGSPSDLVKFDKTMGRFHYEFKQVKQSVYDNYVQFLKTKYSTYLRNAEREMIYG